LICLRQADPRTEYYRILKLSKHLKYINSLSLVFMMVGSEFIILEWPRVRGPVFYGAMRNKKKLKNGV
jgi:hypothetical protein